MAALSAYNIPTFCGLLEVTPQLRGGVNPNGLSKLRPYVGRDPVSRHSPPVTAALLLECFCANS